MVSRDGKVDNFASSLFFCCCCWLLLGLVFWSGIRWSLCMPKSNRSLCVSFSWTGAGLCIYHLFIWSNLNFLHITQWITSPTQSCIVLYSFCTNLLHSLNMWLMISSLSPHSLQMLFCCVLFILALILLSKWKKWNIRREESPCPIGSRAGLQGSSNSNHGFEFNCLVISLGYGLNSTTTVLLP